MRLSATPLQRSESESVVRAELICLNAWIWLQVVTIPDFVGRRGILDPMAREMNEYAAELERSIPGAYAAELRCQSAASCAGCRQRYSLAVVRDRRTANSMVVIATLAD
jgi:hypothetical protein